MVADETVNNDGKSHVEGFQNSVRALTRGIRWVEHDAPSLVCLSDDIVPFTVYLTTWLCYLKAAIGGLCDHCHLAARKKVAQKFLVRQHYSRNNRRMAGDVTGQKDPVAVRGDDEERRCPHIVAGRMEPDLPTGPFVGAEFFVKVYPPGEIHNPQVVVVVKEVQLFFRENQLWDR